jgi:DNA-binding SARP family transcriptional activator/tetratricopeptide (TPR) repeat protein
MPASYYLRCLGAPGLEGPDGHPIRLRTRKQFALFIYLAVEPPQAHRRDRLAEMFWPRVSGPEARHSLAIALSTFRTKLGPRSVQADRDHLQLSLAGLELDLTRLERGDVLGDEFTPPLDIANFLDQFEPPDSTDFLHWRDRQQARLFPAIREGLLRLIDRCRRTGNFRQIEVLADRLLGIDHLSEDGIRAKMEARAFDGDRLSALKLYEAWRESLRAELGAGPSPIVEGIATRLRRRGLERTTGNEIPTVPTDQWKGHRFVGRSREYRALYESWERTARRDSTSALILGDSGVGKTTLADRLTTAAGLEGASAVRTQCYEVDREIPYAALSGLVRGLLDRPGASCTRTGALADLATCLGEVRQRFPSLPAVEPLQGEAVRVRLAEATHELVSAVAEEGPVILVVDDVHLADDASIAVIHQLLRRTREQPVMVVLTARPIELDRSPSARRLRENAPSLGISAVEVPPMTEDESRELLAALVEGAAVTPTLAEQRTLLGAAGGFPMVLELLVREWLAEGRDALALTFSAMTTDPAQGSRAEHAYRALIERLIQELPPEIRNVLNLAAILGNRLNDLEMYGLVDLTLARTMTGMTALADLRLLRDNGKELGFRNELIRAQAYMNLPSTLRRALHSRVADRLIAGQTDRPVTGLELAWHCFRGGRPEEGRDYLITGAREAIDGGAVCEAELALVSALPKLEEPWAAECLLLLCEALQDQGRWRDSLLALGTRDEWIVPDAAMRAFSLKTCADWELRRIDEAEAAQRAKTIISNGLPPSAPTVRSLGLRTLATIVGDTQDRDLAELALEACRPLSMNELTPNERPGYAMLYCVSSHFGQSNEDYESAGTRTEVALDRHGRAMATRAAVALNLTAGSFRTTRGRYEEAIPYFERARHSAERLGHLNALARSYANLSMCHGRLGRYEDQRRLAELGIEAVERTTDIVWFKLEAHAAWANAMLGNIERSLILTREPRQHNRPALPGWARQAHLLLQSDVFRALGRLEASNRLARQATSGEFERLRSRSYAGPFVRALTHLSLVEGQPAQGLAKITTALELVELDAIDLAEVLAAELALRVAIGSDSRAVREQLTHQLIQLPSATPYVLARLGFQVALDVIHEEVVHRGT